jgi:5-methylcytosine-specific restriction endonuclease McrA
MVCNQAFLTSTLARRLVCYECEKKMRRKHGKGFAFSRWEANGNRCWWCGKKLHISDIQADHIIPVTQGGGGGSNIVPSCKRCNSKKSDHPAQAVALGSIPLESTV